jgi:hypothetical protein
MRNWDDLHYNRTVVKGPSAESVLVIVLFNNAGSIVSYHSGADDPAGLSAAVAKLGASYAGVKAQP